jgi:DNA-binding NarL/FixJ family response regulator
VVGATSAEPVERESVLHLSKEDLARAGRPPSTLLDVKVLLVSADPKVRETMELTVRSVKRSGDQPVEFLEASDGLQGMRLAWRHRPDLVVADEITSRAGAFALTKDLKGALPPHPARIVILLDRAQDEWLAAWSEADAWFVKPVNPFELANALIGLLAAPHKEVV